jgi:hypothetical protein
MSILAIQLKKISAFFYILIALLVFNLLFNLSFDWYGISLIVRVYLFVFSFYLIYNYSSIDDLRIRNLYINKQRNDPSLNLFFETRLMPFLIIISITLIFTMIDYIRLPEWPWNPVLSILNGRYINLIIYSLFLLLILKINKGPSAKILLFLGASALYFMLDKLLTAVFVYGPAVSLMKTIKLSMFFFLLFNEFFSSAWSLIKKIALSASSGIVIFCLIMGAYFSIYSAGFENPYPKKESGVTILKYGFSFPLGELKKMAVKHSDSSLLRELLVFMKYYNQPADYTNEEWDGLLFAGSVGMTDMISGYLLDRGVRITYDRIVTYALKKSEAQNGKIENATNFIRLSSRYTGANIEDFMRRIPSSNKSFKLWGISVIGEIKDIKSMPFLIEFLTSIDQNLSASAYDALKKISGIDPAEKSNTKINDPEVIAAFKDYYLKNSKGR